MKNPTDVRMNKTHLADKLCASRTTIAAHLRQDGAPAPDAEGRYSVAEVDQYIRANSERMAERRDFGLRPPTASEYHMTILAPALDAVTPKLVGKNLKQIENLLYKMMCDCAWSWMPPDQQFLRKKG